MTLNEVNIIKNAVLDATEAYVDARLAVADFAKTQIGVIQIAPEQRNGKFYHTVVCNATNTTSGIVYHNVLSVGNTPFPKGSVVFLIAPNAQFSNQFILGKLDNTPVHITGGTIDIGDGNFVVDDDGNVTIKKGGIYLNKATGDNYHLVLNSAGIKLGYASSGYKFTVDSIDGSVTIKNGQINLGAVTQSGTIVGYDVNINSSGFNLGYNNVNDYNFSVTERGIVTIKSGKINLNYNSTYNQYNFVVDNNGIKLGVTGTSSSDYNFIVTNNGKVTIKSGSWTIGNVFKIDDSGNLAVGGTSSSAPFYVQSSDGSVSIKKGNIDIANKFHVDASGWLAIGGTTSSANFYVANNGYVTAKHLTADVGGSIGGFKITSDALGDSIGTDACVGMKKGDKLFTWSAGKKCDITFGQIYVATGADTNGIRVYSSSDYNGNYIQYGYSDIYRSSDGKTVSWSGTSDKRLKKNIKDLTLEEAKALILSVRPRKFRFKKEVEEKGERYGFIAQELREILNDENGIEYMNSYDFHNVHYEDFISPLCKIVQDQQKQIDALKALIKDK